MTALLDRPPGLPRTAPCGLSSERDPRLTSMARHSRVNSSTTFSRRRWRPSAIVSLMKSSDQRCLGRVAVMRGARSRAARCARRRSAGMTPARRLRAGVARRHRSVDGPSAEGAHPRAPVEDATPVGPADARAVTVQVAGVFRARAGESRGVPRVVARAQEAAAARCVCRAPRRHAATCALAADAEVPVTAVRVGRAAVHAEAVLLDLTELAGAVGTLCAVRGARARGQGAGRLPRGCRSKRYHRQGRHAADGARTMDNPTAVSNEARPPARRFHGLPRVARNAAAPETPCVCRRGVCGSLGGRDRGLDPRIGRRGDLRRVGCALQHRVWRRRGRPLRPGGSRSGIRGRLRPVGASESHREGERPRVPSVGAALAGSGLSLLESERHQCTGRPPTTHARAPSWWRQIRLAPSAESQSQSKLHASRAVVQAKAP